LRSSRRLCLLTCSLLVLAGLLSIPAAAGMTYSSRLYMSEKFPAFHGRIHSASNFCEADRRVKLFKVRPGKDKLLGVDRSDDNGHWKVALGNQLVSGVYYSKAPLYGSASLGITCLPDTSQMAVVD
jgi:hypothetical protein